MRKGFKALLALTILLICSVATVWAQVPCSGDPDDPGYDPNGCPAPLDTWVIVLVALALVLGYRHLQKKQSTATSL
ncbi:hypothetical protein HQ865_14735 [Mucilaginibacter mali]|uniref:Uncharacterized protein n=1 Tax=Mucilaginibacter mali TaxID=2740462 RepID=A0A7D4QGA6_9SPHI|nr:hypothetical protein [Mucilaginibacter mali]QKJ30952.1 hypothetical protein HQ865_14735 [Mucilaginibacter mali]